MDQKISAQKEQDEEAKVEATQEQQLRGAAQKNSSMQKEIEECISKHCIPEDKEQLQQFEEGIRESIYKRYANLIKNAHQYLCYLYLLTYNFDKCIEHGKKLLDFHKTTGFDFLKVSNSAAYVVNMYIAEALCMLARFPESLRYMEAAEEIC